MLMRFNACERFFDLKKFPCENRWLMPLWNTRAHRGFDMRILMYSRKKISTQILHTPWNVHAANKVHANVIESNKNNLLIVQIACVGEHGIYFTHRNFRSEFLWNCNLHNKKHNFCVFRFRLNVFLEKKYRFWRAIGAGGFCTLIVYGHVKVFFVIAFHLVEIKIVIKFLVDYLSSFSMRLTKFFIHLDFFNAFYAGKSKSDMIYSTQ